MPQLENGYTRIATELVDKFCKYRFSGQEWQILWVIIRKTYGWQKKSDQISYSQISSITGIERRNVISLVNKLVCRGSVKKDTTSPITLSLVKDYTKWVVVLKKTPSVKKHTRVVLKSIPKVVLKNTPTIDNKDTIQKIESLFSYYLLKTKKQFKLTADRKDLIKKRLSDGYTLEQLKLAVDSFVKDDWEGRADNMDLIYCIGKQRGKPDHLEKWLNKTPKEKEKSWSKMTA